MRRGPIVCGILIGVQVARAAFDPAIWCQRKPAAESHDAPVAQVRASFPPTTLHTRPVRDDYEVCCDITLNLSGRAAELKAPIVRVCILARGSDGECYMKDGIFDKFGSVSHFRRSPPVYSYGERADGFSQAIGERKSVYWLEGVSYYLQKLLPRNMPRKGIRYFNKAEDGNRGLFRLSGKICGKKPPEIVCYRLECWQNGALAGTYDSKTPSALESLQIPVDWYVYGKHPSKLNYVPRSR